MSPSTPDTSEDEPATKKDLRILAAELRGEMHAMRADLVAMFESRTRALFFSQIASILAVAAIAFAD